MSINRRSTGGNGEDPRPSFADEIRARTSIRRLARGDEEGGGFQGGPGLFSLFNRFDMVVFVLLFVALYYVVKLEYGVDLAPMIWDKIKPDYDAHIVNEDL